MNQPRLANLEPNFQTHPKIFIFWELRLKCVCMQLSCCLIKATLDNDMGLQPD